MEQQLFMRHAIFMYKSLNGKLPSYLTNMFKFCDNDQLRSASQHKLVVPMVNLETGRKAFSYLGARLWNELPLTIRGQRNVFGFKKSLKDFILSM